MEIEKQPHDFGDGVIVYHAEIFLLVHITQHKGASVTELAKILEMTKGSVSEVLKKLDQKGYIIKSRSPQNASRIRIDISEKGRQILDKHDQIHENSESGFRNYCENLDFEKQQFLEDFFSVYEEFLVEIKNKKVIK